MLRQLLLVLATLLLPLNALADVVATRAAISIETGLGPVADAAARTAMETKVGSLGFKVLGNDAFVQAAANAGALQNGAMLSGAVALDRLRQVSESAIVLRLYSTETSGDRSTLRLVVVDAGGARAVEWSATTAELADRVPKMIDAAWREPPIAVAKLAAAAGPASPAGAVSAPPMGPAYDTLIFKNGARIKGRVMSEVAGQTVTIKQEDGATRTYAWTEIERIDRRITESRTNANLGSGGLMYSQQTGCPPGAPPEQCQERSTLTANASGAQFNKETDCAPGETEAQCQERFQAGIGKGGIGIGYSKTNVERVQGPPRSFAMSLGIGANVMFGTGTGDLDLTLFGGGLQANLDMYLGKFPGGEGGTFLGGFLEPQVAGNLITMSVAGNSSTVGGARFGAAGGLQYIGFKTLDQATLKQSGFGLRGGVFLGGNMMAVGGGDPQVSFAWGPSLGVSFLDFNPATAKVSGYDITALILPGVGDIFMAIVGFGIRL